MIVVKKAPASAGGMGGADAGAAARLREGPARAARRQASIRSSLIAALSSTCPPIRLVA